MTTETQPQPHDGQDPFSRFDECALAVETLDAFLREPEQGGAE
jgi:hypothetical protein